MTEYVATRWYRAPEVMLSFRMYSKVSTGASWQLHRLTKPSPLTSGPSAVFWQKCSMESPCFLVKTSELNRCACFQLLTGQSHHQLSLIMDVLGTPKTDEFYAITSRRSRDYIRAMAFRPRRSFASLFPRANPLAVDFLTRTLTCELCTAAARRRNH
jgi:mitogen-activated protein kinase 1/3